MIRRRKGRARPGNPIPDHPEEDPTGAESAARDFNGHDGPARIFYNRHAETFYTRRYPLGSEKWWGTMADNLDYVEIYRKTSAMPNVTVRPDDLRLMAQEIRPYMGAL